MLEKQNRPNITKQNMKYLNQEYKAKYEQFLVNSKNMKKRENMDKAKYALSLKRDMENHQQETSLKQ